MQAGQMPQSVDDCMDDCSEEFEDVEKWCDCVDACVQTLCELEIIECDE